MDATKPKKLIGLGAMNATKPYGFIGLGAMNATKPYKFIGLGAVRGGNPQQLQRREIEPTRRRTKLDRQQCGVRGSILRAPKRILIPGVWPCRKSSILGV